MKLDYQIFIVFVIINSINGEQKNVIKLLKLFKDIMLFRKYTKF